MNKSIFNLVFIFSLLLSGCGSKWQMTEQKFFKFQNKDIRIAAKIILTEKKDKLNASKSDGVDFDLRIYSGNYNTILKEFSTKAGAELENSGTVNTPLIFTYAVSEPRLGGTAYNSYPDLCAEIKMEKSNLENWTKVGCLNYTDEPLESPTGGIGLTAAE